MHPSKERSREIDKGIDRLFERWDGNPLTLQEIADAAGVSQPAVHCMITTAIKKLRRSKLRYWHEG